MHRWLRQGRQLNRQKTPRPTRRKLAPDQERELLDMVDCKPGLTLAFIAKHALECFGTAVSERTVSNLMTRNKITRKKGTKVNIDYKHKLGMEYLQDIRQIYLLLLCSLDEESLMLNLAPAYGWAMGGLQEVKELSYVSQARVL